MRLFSTCRSGHLQCQVSKVFQEDNGVMSMASTAEKRKAMKLQVTHSTIELPGLVNDHTAIAGIFFTIFDRVHTSTQSKAPIFQPAMLVDPGVYHISSLLPPIFSPSGETGGELVSPGA